MRARRSLKSQWLEAAGNFSPDTDTFGASQVQTGVDATTGAATHDHTPGEAPHAFFERAVTAGVRPMDAIRIISATGYKLGPSVVYNWLLPHLGEKRARAISISFVMPDGDR